MHPAAWQAISLTNFTAVFQICLKTDLKVSFECDLGSTHGNTDIKIKMLLTRDYHRISQAKMPIPFT